MPDQTQTRWWIWNRSRLLKFPQNIGQIVQEQNLVTLCSSGFGGYTTKDASIKAPYGNGFETLGPYILENMILPWAIWPYVLDNFIICSGQYLHVSWKIWPYFLDTMSISLGKYDQVSWKIRSYIWPIWPYILNDVIIQIWQYTIHL